MLQLRNLLPANYLEEKEKFFSDRSYNPQFRYEVLPKQSYLQEYGKEYGSFSALAQEIIDQKYFNRSAKEVAEEGGNILGHDQVIGLCLKYLEENHLSGHYVIEWSDTPVSRASINHKQRQLTLKKNAEFRECNTMGMLFHEIGTHALRQLNYEQQPWFKKKTEYGFSDYLATEEGLATVHTLLPFEDKSAYSSAIRYIASLYAQTHSFTELWKLLSAYIHEPELRWMITFRQKRGIADTSQPGGYTKDVIYFAGAMLVADWLQKHSFNLPSLYFGKIAVSDVEKAEKLSKGFSPLLPIFYTADKDKYAEQLDAIVQYNHFLQ